MRDPNNSINGNERSDSLPADTVQYSGCVTPVDCTVLTQYQSKIQNDKTFNFMFLSSNKR